MINPQPSIDASDSNTAHTMKERQEDDNVCDEQAKADAGCLTVENTRCSRVRREGRRSVSSNIAIVASSDGANHSIA
jgi:hypothetical protein